MAGDDSAWLMSCRCSDIGAKIDDLYMEAQKSMEDIAGGRRRPSSIHILMAAVNDPDYVFIGFTTETVHKWDRHVLCYIALGRHVIAMAGDPAGLFNEPTPKCVEAIAMLMERAPILGAYVVDICHFHEVYSMGRMDD